MIWKALKSQLTNQREQLDGQIEKTLLQLQSSQYKIYCQAGCGNCCTLAVHCSFPEAYTIAATLSDQQKTALKDKITALLRISRESENLKQFLQSFRSDIKGCAFLDPKSSNCSIYQNRPLSCRALLSTRPDSWCGVDFSQLHPLEKQAFLSSLDPEVVNFPTHYLAQPQKLATELEAELTMNMYDQLTIGLTGNLLFLVWLELEEQLSQMIINDPQQATNLLADTLKEHPFLIQFRVP